MNTDPRTLAAKNILTDCDRGAVAVSKVIRAGLTTSIKKAAEEMGVRLLCIEPTRRIIKETIGGSATVIPGNYECFILDEEIRAFPILAELPLSLPDCSKCQGYDSCPITQILRDPDFDVAALTYSKIRALMLSGSKTSKAIKEALQKADFVFLDEAHLLGFDSVPSVPGSELKPAPMHYKSLRKVRDLWAKFLENHAGIIEELRTRAAGGVSWQHLSRYALVDDPLGWKGLRGAWKDLIKAAKLGEMTCDDLLKYRDVAEILSFDWATVHFISEDEGQGGYVAVSGSHNKGEMAVSSFLQHVVPYAGHIYASGTLIEPHPGFFSELSGKPVRAVSFPDIMRTSERVTLIPDCWDLNGRGFSRKLPDIIDQIRQIAEREREPIYCLCQSGTKAAVVKSKLREIGVKNVTVDYFRSDLSIGVERGERICIIIGRAEVPTNAYDPLAWGRTEEERRNDSRRLRELAVVAATWQAVNRVRDPQGETESRIYLIGVTLEKARDLCRWGPGRSVVIKSATLKKSNMGRHYVDYVLETTVEEDIEHCKILGEDVKRNHSEKRSLAELVVKVELYDENKINSENHSFLPIKYIRSKGVKLGFYNFPKCESELELNTTSLYNVFVLRDDTYVELLKNGEYTRIIDYCRRDELMDHVSHKRTIGVYEISLDDEVSWGCFDADSHGENDDPEEAKRKVRALCDVLDVYGVPHMVEASGSLGSYHLWIFFKRTRTYNAFVFMRQVAREAKVKNVEIWPKQKKLNKDSKFGNPVKLPLGLNWKNGAFSAFMDAETFEPLEGFIQVPGRVHLVEVPNPKDEEKAMPKARTAPTATPSPASQTLDYCMVQTLMEGTPLEGGEGHEMRVAIAVKGAFIGMTPEAVGALFSGQPDYNPEFSIYKAKEIGDRHLSPYSCATLRDKCGASRWCPTCPFGGALHLEGVQLS